MSNTYLDHMAQFQPKYNQNQEIIDRKSFNKAIAEQADEIVSMLPDLLAEVLDRKAADLFAKAPESILKEDPVTHDKLTEEQVRRLLASKTANLIGHGLTFLQK
ncbi:hypothetical protein [Escherichia coli]|uniref:hypothetical protein n=1 Tax=Escherichia coli TaxID=562 RepID=UPI00132A2752|nr:hypothetical protein [Escherichia coli]EJE3394407.1 hypothetical protein [Escherichia coli]MWN33518.1 hypothetical protein [Escherichia coli]MWN51917.1 hypothetical protein [Escherichia coli]MWN56932.1 hypothetical protein [Escherichia coli]MWN65587.1 hypothetical protein [Escherichia coli]